MLKIKLFSARTPPRTPLGELTTLPRTLSSMLERGLPLDVSTLAPRLSGPNTNSWLCKWPTPFFSGLQLAYPLEKTSPTTDKLADVGL